MAVQWPYNSPAPQGQGYAQYTQQYGQQAPLSCGQQQPLQYGAQQHGQQQFQQSPQAYSQQPTQQYPRQLEYPQQATHQHYPAQQQFDPQQQYPPQQHYDPQQQYPLQQQYPPQSQYLPQQGGQYVNHYPPTTSAAYASQPQPQPTPGCYNCGAAGHWAQACPEPKRENPAGAYNRPPPFKRQKPNPPVVTKYAVPPHVQQQHALPPQAFVAPYAQPPYPQYQGPHGPPTPQSVQSPHQQWPQQPSQQPYQQSYQQPCQHPYQPAHSQQQQYSQLYEQTGSQHQQQPCVPNAPPTPATPYASHRPSQVSPQAAQYNAASYFPNGHYQQPLGPQGQQMSSASPVSPVTQMVARQGQHANDTGETTMTPTIQSAEITEEEDDDDLCKLDVPDIPVIQDGSFASLVDRPLPAHFIVAEALEPFDPPPPENNGCCQSKYTVIDKLSTFTSSIQNTKYWDDMKNDPIFLPCSLSSKVVPLERIRATYQTRCDDEEYDPADLEDGEWTRGSTVLHHEEGRDLMDRLENTLGVRTSMTESSQIHGNSLSEPNSREDASSNGRHDRSIEVPNNLQGRGGQYYWKRKSMRPIPPPPVREDSLARSPEHTPPMRSRTPSMYELNEMYQLEQGTIPGGSGIRSSIPFGSVANGHEDGGQHPSYDLSDPFEPPPPPAHHRKPSSYDGAADGALPAGSPNGQVHGNGVSGPHGSIGRSCSNEQSASPTRRRSDAVNGRKREQALSDEDNTPKRRQVDDTKFKLKKRQPKVAAAYR
ncbi:MAG: hypothetical protein Q9166_003883 [cf. Caloplaca sp. 2 TL-2023]